MIKYALIIIVIIVIIIIISSSSSNKMLKAMQGLFCLSGCLSSFPLVDISLLAS